MPMKVLVEPHNPLWADTFELNPTWSLRHTAQIGPVKSSWFYGKYGNVSQTVAKE